MLVSLNSKVPLDIVEDEEGFFVVTCPLLPELHTQGDTLDEAIENAAEALEATIHGYQLLGRALPAGIECQETKEYFDVRIVKAGR